MALLNGKIDFACTQKIINPAIEWVPVMNSGLSAAVSLQNPLSARKSLHWEDLAGEQFICDRVGIDREFLEGVCKNHGFKPTVAIECGEGRLVGVLLENNRGVGVIPDHDLPGLIANFENTPRNAVNIPIVDDDAVVTVGLARLRDRDMSHAAKELYDFLIEYLHDMKSRSQEAVEQLWGEK
jgi:DNA-binding transcriptional LysR family regulator